MYTLYFFDEKGSRNRIGSVKIGQFGMKAEQRRPELKDSFTKIGKKFFSLGQDDTYYESLNGLGAELRDSILAALCDLAYSEPDLLSRAQEERGDHCIPAPLSHAKHTG